ncbi:MAG: AMP-binding protein [Deltaproteobacteria bacterium]|nr:AMP-binding protein [Deltaproteobacteria bacterium]MBW2070675.1 AMP-binding protein [Deltaproteobacteria bacterium]
MECQPREDLVQLQLERLQATLNRAYRNVPFYHNRFEQVGVEPSHFRSLEDLSRLPLTSRDDLSMNYPYGLFAVPLRDIVRIHSTTGTDVRPTVSGYTRKDLKVWKELVARCLCGAGVGPEDIIQICFDPGLADWAREFKDGAEAMQASVIPMTVMEIPKQIMVMNDYKTSVLVSTPSYLRQIIREMTRMGINPNALSLKRAVLLGETLSQKTRTFLADSLHINIHTAYGLSEVPGPGIAYECNEHDGLHINEDHFVVEIIDPESGAVLPAEQNGEVVLTTLTAQAYPLVRFRTGDRGSITMESCNCGRVFARLRQGRGRTDSQLVIRGVKIHPRLIEGIISQLVQGKKTSYVGFVRRQEELDLLEIWIEVDEDNFSDEIKVLEQLVHRMRQELEQRLGIPARVRLVESMSMAACREHLGRIVDQRTNG